MMRKWISLVAIVAWTATTLLAQPTDVALAEDLEVKYGKTITVERLKEHLTTIASDAFRGRETGSEYIKLAEKYITDHLKEFGIPTLPQLGDSYLQPVGYKKESWGDVSLVARKTEYKNMRDFYAFASLSDELPMQKAKKVLFLGYGIETEGYNDYDGVETEERIVLMYQGVPKDADGKPYANEKEWDWRKKLEVARAHGVSLVLFIDPNTLRNINRYGRWLIEPSFELDAEDEPSTYANHMFISTTMTEGILGRKYKKLGKAVETISATGKPLHFEAKANLTVQMHKNVEHSNTPNILGFVEGSDKKEEVVVVSAHYDHIGFRGDDIFNGADDNGSGTSGLLAMAEAMAKAKADGHGPRRSVLFLWVAGEEKGLLGSEFYSENPIFNLENTVVDINVDMIGRVDKAYEKANNPNYVYVIGADRLSTALHEINESVNKGYENLTLDYTYNDENDPNRYYYRSDHYNFAKHGIPSIFFFNGTHDDYHRAGDTVDKIEFEKMSKITRHIFYLAWRLAHREERIQVDVPQQDGK